MTTEGCRVDNLESGPMAGSASIAWTRHCPCPSIPRPNQALKLAPILDDLDRYELKITGLAAGTYEVNIDGEAVGKFSSEELAKGLNLADSAGPITKQARQVLELVFHKNNLYFNRWRNVQLYSSGMGRGTGRPKARRVAELARTRSTDRR